MSPEERRNGGFDHKGRRIGGELDLDTHPEIQSLSERTPEGYLAPEHAEKFGRQSGGSDEHCV